MAALEFTRPVASGLSVGGRITAIVVAYFARLADWHTTEQTRKALRKLSDRELEDIGLNRGDIEEITATSHL